MFDLPQLGARCLFPLHGGGGLGRDVVHDAVHVFDFVADFGAHVLKKLGFKLEPICRHAVLAGDGAQPNHVRVRALIPLQFRV